MKMTFLRDTDLLVTNDHLGRDELYYEKGERVKIAKYSEYEIGKDMWCIWLPYGTEFFVLKENVEIST